MPKASLCFVRSIDTPIPTLLYFLLRSRVLFLHPFACALSEIRRVLIRRSNGRQTMTATTAVEKPSERGEQSMTVSFSLCCFVLPANDARFHARDIANNAAGAVDTFFSLLTSLSHAPLIVTLFLLFRSVQRFSFRLCVCRNVLDGGKKRNELIFRDTAA